MADPPEAASPTVPRVLPEVGEHNAFFWRAGEHGELRFLRCRACGLYLHPPQPVCRHCRSADVAPEAVSGRGEVLSFTVNHHSWVPSSAPGEPYVIAVVELPEQPALRLTTNIVGCAPAEVRAGMPVHVVFERHDDVWLPLFAPDDAPTA